MQFDYPYEILDSEARTRLEALGDYLQNRHGIGVVWNDEHKASFSGRYLVVKIEGTLTFGDGTLQFRGRDPGLLWRKKAIAYLQGKLAKYLDPSTPSETLPRG
ncbi:MAG: polyhydroxyalkanoic acid system family protein [Proteobacteria bacterium]|nr:polyhydroxyalkanoic acid system family protein [Pseudomonadota bacterium]